MRDGVASETAYRAGMARALHQVADQPRIFNDPLAHHFVRPEDASRLHKTGRGPLWRAMRGALAARSRITEDALHDAVARGIRQYVVLGAGFDTYALRSPHAQHGLQVFEVDHPDTQAAKRRMAETSGLVIPPTLRWAPVDFSKQHLADGLAAAGFDFARPAFFSFLGVSMYLPEAALHDTFRTIAQRCAPGTEVMFDYVVQPRLLPWLDRFALAVTRRRVAQMGEQMQTFLDPQEVPALLRSLGFSRCEPVDLAAFATRIREEHRLPASRKPPRFGMGRMAHAVV
jgi:methyltransferase (TIGR00027 family)